MSDNIEYRALADEEIKEGDLVSVRSLDASWWACVPSSWIGKNSVTTKRLIRRPKLESDDSKAALDSMVEISEEFGMYNGKLIVKDEPTQHEWDGEVLNKKFGENAAFEKYKMLYKGEFCLVYKSESHVECAGRVDECEFRPIKSQAELEADKREEEIKKLEDFLMVNSTLYVTSCYGIAELIVNNYLSQSKG